MSGRSRVRSTRRWDPPGLDLIEWQDRRARWQQNKGGIEETSFVCVVNLLLHYLINQYEPEWSAFSGFSILSSIFFYIIELF